MKKLLLTAALGLLVNVGIGTAAFAGGDISQTAIAPIPVMDKANVTESQKPLVKPKITLEKAQSIAEKMFGVTKDYKREMANYEDSPERRVWTFSWNKNVNGAYSNIFVGVDADTGEIRNYSYSDPAIYQQNYDFASAFTREEAHKKALVAMKKYMPTKISSLKEIDVPQYNNVIYGKREMQRYQFRFIRVINGIPFGDDSAQMTVTENGKIIDFSFNWTNIADELALPKITQQEAQQTFKNKIGLSLAYTKDFGTNGPQNPKLVYQIADNMNVYIDAVTGEVKNNSGMLFYGANMDKGGMGGASAPVSDKFYIGKSKIAEEDAEKIATEMLNIPAGYTIAMREFRTDYFSKRSMWYLNFTMKDADNGSLQISVGVAADNGEILEMNRYSSRPVDPPKTDAKKLTYLEGRKIAEDFINKIAPEKKQKVKLDDNQEQMLQPEYLKYNNNYWFHYTRQVNAIPAVGEGISINVDTVTGEVIGFRQDFSVGLTFPAIKNVLPMEKMLTKFFKNPGLKLTYFKIYPMDYQGVASKAYINLGYRVSGEDPRTFDVSTGEPIYQDWQKPIVKKSYPVDIAGKAYSEEINKVIDLNIMGGRTKTAFYPEAVITKTEFVKALLAAKGYIPDYSATKLPYKDVPAKSWYAPYLRMALKQGLITTSAKFEPVAPLTKEEASKMITRALGYGKIADFDIYKKPKGNGFVNDSYGYIAIAESFKIFPGNKKDYTSLLTRGESAKMILNMLTIKK